MTQLPDLYFSLSIVVKKNISIYRQYCNLLVSQQNSTQMHIVVISPEGQVSCNTQINLLFPAQFPCADLVKQKTRFLLSYFLLCWQNSFKDTAHRSPDISAYKTCFLTHAVFQSKTSPPNHFSTSSLHMFSLLRGRGQYPSLRLGTSSSRISGGFPKRFSISTPINGSVLSCWKDDAASPQSLLTEKWV